MEGWLVGYVPNSAVCWALVLDLLRFSSYTFNNSVGALLSHIFIFILFFPHNHLSPHTLYHLHSLNSAPHHYTDVRAHEFYLFFLLFLLNPTNTPTHPELSAYSL